MRLEIYRTKLDIYRTKLGRNISQVGRASYRRAPTTVGVVRYISSDIFLKNCDIFLREREGEYTTSNAQRCRGSAQRDTTLLPHLAAHFKITVIIVRYPSDYGDSILTNLLAPRSGRPEANREAIYVRSHP